MRRSVAFSRAVYKGEAQVEDVRAVLVRDLKGAEKVLEEGRIAVIVDETASIREAYQPEVVIDAVMAKRNIGTSASRMRLWSSELVRVSPQERTATLSLRLKRGTILDG